MIKTRVIEVKPNISSTGMAIAGMSESAHKKEIVDLNTSADMVEVTIIVKRETEGFGRGVNIEQYLC